LISARRCSAFCCLGDHPRRSCPGVDLVVEPPAVARALHAVQGLGDMSGPAALTADRLPLARSSARLRARAVSAYSAATCENMTMKQDKEKKNRLGC